MILSDKIDVYLLNISKQLNVRISHFWEGEP